MRVGLILDTTCLLTYLKNDDPSSLDVAELVFSVHENGDITGIPGLCAVEIYEQLDSDERERLIELAANDAGPARLLPLPAADVVNVAELSTGMTPAQAHAVTSTRRHNAVLATYDLQRVRTLLAPQSLLDMNSPDDF